MLNLFSSVPAAASVNCLRRSRNRGELHADNWEGGSVDCLLSSMPVELLRLFHLKLLRLALVAARLRCQTRRSRPSVGGTGQICASPSAGSCRRGSSPRVCGAPADREAMVNRFAEARGYAIDSRPDKCC